MSDTEKFIRIFGIAAVLFIAGLVAIIQIANAFN